LLHFLQFDDPDLSKMQRGLVMKSIDQCCTSGLSAGSQQLKYRIIEGPPIPLF
jgi:hypothetical protein